MVAAVTLGTFTRRGHSADPGPAYLGLAPLLLGWIWRQRHRAEVLAVAAMPIGRNRHAGEGHGGPGSRSGREWFHASLILLVCVIALGGAM